MSEEETKEREVKLCKRDLEAWQIGKNDLDMFNKELSEKKQQVMDKFNEENKDLIERIGKLSEETTTEQNIFRGFAVEEFKKTGEKKLICGLGIRVGTNFIYEDKAAFDWAINHKLCLKLDSRAFEKIAKNEDIDFVKKEEKITATFPKEIEITSPEFGPVEKKE